MSTLKTMVSPASISEGVVALRAVLIDGRQSFPVAGGGILWMVGISAAYLLFGIAVFSLGERSARS